jgi:hypothetical protein
MPQGGDFDGVKQKDRCGPCGVHRDLDASDFGNSHQPNALMNHGMLRYVVAATLRTLPMNMAS